MKPRFVSRILDTSPHWAETPLFLDALPFLTLESYVVSVEWRKLALRLAQRLLELEAPCAVCLRRFHVVQTDPLVARSFLTWTTDPPRVVSLTVSCGMARNPDCAMRSLRGQDRERATKAMKELRAEVAWRKGSQKPDAPQLSLFTRR